MLVFVIMRTTFLGAPAIMRGTGIRAKEDMLKERVCEELKREEGRRDGGKAERVRGGRIVSETVEERGTCRKRTEVGERGGAWLPMEAPPFDGAKQRSP